MCNIFEFPSLFEQLLELLIFWIDLESKSSVQN
jgi:hypothetical protein